MIKFRSYFKKKYPVVCAYHLCNNVKAFIALKMGRLESLSGMTHADKDISSSLTYINEVFMDYKYYGRVKQFHGRVAEVGPGDNCGVGLLFLRDGCDSVDLVDRFYSKRNSPQQAAIYRMLTAGNPSSGSKSPGDADLYDDDSFAGVKRFYGEKASAELFFETHKDYDFIVSRAVLEHVYNPALALMRMASALTPEGMMLHKVDLGDHGMFSPQFHELKYYEVPDWLYKRMTKSAGYPNRVLINQYNYIMKQTGLDFTFLVTRLAGAGEIRPHVPYEDIQDSYRKEASRYVRSVRKRFAASFSNLSDEELSITGFFVVARKKK